MGLKHRIKFKLIIQEFNVLMHKDLGIMILIVLSVMGSCIITVFFFGFTHHIEQEAIDKESGDRFFIASFYDPWQTPEEKNRVVRDKTVKKKDIMDLLMEMNEEVFRNCLYIEMACKYEDDIVEDPDTDSLALAAVIDFMIENGKIIVPHNMEKRIIGNGMLVDGRYFTQDDFDQKRLLCIAWPQNTGNGNLRGDYSPWWDKYMPTDKGVYIVDGMEFECIGHSALYTCVPRIPATVMRDDVFVMELILEFDPVVTRRAYETIYSSLKSKYGDMVNVKELELKQTDFSRFNNTIISILITVMILSMIIITILYSQMIIRREDCFRVYRICGMTNDQICSIILGEMRLLIIGALILAIIAYHFLILPCLEKSFEYLRYSARINIYLIIPFFFITLSNVFLRIAMIRFSNTWKKKQY